MLAGCAANSYAGIGLSEPAATAEEAELQALARRAWSGDRDAKLELARRFDEGDGVPADREMARRLAASAGAAIGGQTTMYVPRGDGSVGPVIVGAGTPARIGVSAPSNAPASSAPFVAQGARTTTELTGLPAEIIRDLIKYEHFNKKCLLDQPIAYRVTPLTYAQGGAAGSSPRADRAIAFTASEIAAIRRCFAQSALPERCQDHQAETVTVAKLVMTEPGFAALLGSMTDLVTYCVEPHSGAASRPAPHGRFADFEVGEGMASAPDVSLIGHLLAPRVEAPGTNMSSRAREFEIAMCGLLGERSAYNFRQVPPLDVPASDGDPPRFEFSAADVLICSLPGRSSSRLDRGGRNELSNAISRKGY